MAASSGAVRGYGSTVRVGVGATPEWTVLSGVEEFEFPDQTPDNEDATHLGSPNDTEEAIRGMKKVAVWPLNLHYVPGLPTDVVLTGLDATEEDFILELTPVGATPRQFACFLNSWRPTGIGPRGKMMAVATITVKGELVV